MNRARVFCAVLGLAAGLLFYLAHRSDRTLSNRLVSWACGPDVYAELKHDLRPCVPVPALLRGCLPSALWSFIATSLVSGWSIRASGNRLIALAPLCPLFNALWEVVQALGWSDGHADLQDVAAGCIGWLVAQLAFLSAGKPVEIPLRWTWRLGVVLSGVACIGLADVWK